MARVYEDRVRDTTTSTGTGSVSISGVAPLTYRTFSAVCSVGDTFPYTIASRVANEWETGLGTYSATNTITRTTVFRSSNANAAVSFSAGTKDIIMSMVADRPTMQQWLGVGGIISAEHYGFSPSNSGGANSTAINNALAAAAGGTLWIPAGTYNVAPTAAPAISVTNNNTRIIGAGPYNTIINTQTTGQDILSVNALNIFIQGLQLTCGSTMSSGTAAFRCIGDKITSKDMYINGGPGAGTGGRIYDGLLFVGNAANYEQLHQNYNIQRCAHAGIRTSGSGGTYAVTLRDFDIGCFWGTSGNPTSSNSTQYGVRGDATGAGGFSLRDVNVIQSYDFGISAVGSGWDFERCGADTCGTDDWNFNGINNLRLTNCWAGANFGSAGSNQGNGFTFNSCNGVELRGCSAADLQVMFAWIQNCTNIICVGNRCPWGNQANAGAGAGFFVQNCAGFMISDNIISNTSAEWGSTGSFKYGVNIDALSGAGAGPSTYGRIDGNIFHPVATQMVLNNASSGTVSVGTNQGP